MEMDRENPIGRRNRYYGISRTKYFDRKYTDYHQESGTRNENAEYMATSNISLYKLTSQKYLFIFTNKEHKMETRKKAAAHVHCCGSTEHH